MKHLFHGLAEYAFRHSLYLEQEAFLKASSAYARRVEALQDMEHVLYLLLGYIDVVIDHQLIADAVEILAKQAVVVRAIR